MKQLAFMMRGRSRVGFDVDEDTTLQLRDDEPLNEPGVGYVPSS